LLSQIKTSVLLFLTGVGLILCWRGIWELSAELFDPKVSLILGLAILVGLAAIKKRQLFKVFGMADIQE